MSAKTPVSVVRIEAQESAETTSGILKVAHMPGFPTLFYTVTPTGGRYEISYPFTAGDIEAVAPSLKVISRTEEFLEYSELPELTQFRERAAALAASRVPERTDLTDILEP